MDNTTEFTGTLSLYDEAGTQVVSVTSGDASPYSGGAQFLVKH